MYFLWTVIITIDILKILAKWQHYPTLRYTIYHNIFALDVLDSMQIAFVHDIMMSLFV